MENYKLKWLRGPPPPISESIFSSGLINDSVSQSTNLTFQKANNKSMNNQKKVFQSAPAPLFKTTKIPFKPTHVLSLRPKKDTTLKPYYPPIDIEPHLDKNYKAPSIDETALTFKKASSSIIPTENLTHKVLLPKQPNYREFVQELVHELDSNIASVVPVSSETILPEKQAQVQLQLIEFYNYSFNQLILKERTISSDKAILLRRFMKFYNQIICDYPNIVNNIKSKINQFVDENDKLKEKINELNEKVIIANDSIQKLEINNKEILEKLEKTVNDSNSKDLTISTITFDNELSKSQLNKLQFRYNKLKEENENLSNSLKLRDDEIKGQIGQIEKVTKKLAEYQQGDTGYIVMYHQEKDKIAKLEKEIDELKQKIFELENVEKTSIAVDTSDIPVKKTKKKKIIKNTSATNSTVSSQLNDENEKQKQNSKLKSQQIETTEKSSQTDLTGLINLSVENEPVTFSIDHAESIENTDPNITTKSEEEKSSNDAFNISNYLNGLNTPDGYDDKVNEVPVLPKFITPLFSEVYIPTVQTDLKIIEYKNDQKATQNPKPLIWGLQLIHAFLTDPFVRSIENKTRLSCEDIFVDWIVNKYKVQHLVNQVISDLTNILSKFRYNQTIHLFIDLLEGYYNFSQLCFLSTVYTFSCSLTIPNVIQIYQNYESSENEEIRIHIKAIHKLYSLCFSEEVANSIVKKIISQNNCEEKSDTEMVSFVSFLRNITEYFGEKHKLISNQARDLLSLFGCSDINVIIYDVFESVMMILGSPQESIKADWKNILYRLGNRENQFISVVEMLELCAEKEEQLHNLMSIPNLKKSLNKMINISQVVYEFYHEFIKRFSKTLPHVLSLVSNKIKKKVMVLIQKLKIAILELDIQKMIWIYKKLITKIDCLKMKETGFIPFDYLADADTIYKLSQYINKAEEVSFAMLS